MKFKLVRAPLALLLLAGCGGKSAEQTPTAPLTEEKTAPENITLNALATPVTAPTTAPTAAATTATSSTRPNVAPVAQTTPSASVRVRGQIVELPTANGGTVIVVNHENIPGLMPAMQMRFPLAAPGQARKFAPGDKIAFDLERQNLRVSNIEKLPPATKLQLAP